jgi:hypothetical protein
LSWVVKKVVPVEVNLPVRTSVWGGMWSGFQEVPTVPVEVAVSPLLVPGVYAVVPAVSVVVPVV